MVRFSGKLFRHGEKIRLLGAVINHVKKILESVDYCDVCADEFSAQNYLLTIADFL